MQYRFSSWFNLLAFTVPFVLFAVEVWFVCFSCAGSLVWNDAAVFLSFNENAFVTLACSSSPAAGVAMAIQKNYPKGHQEVPFEHILANDLICFMHDQT